MKFDRVNEDILYHSQSSLEKYIDGEERSKFDFYTDRTGSAERAKIEKKYTDRFSNAQNLNTLVTYQGNKEIPYLSLYRYKEAFSFQLVDLILRNFRDETLQVFDPYCGMGTTLFASAYNGVEAYGIDKLPLAVQMSNSLLDAVVVDIDAVKRQYAEIKENLSEYQPADIADDVSVVQRVIPDETKRTLQRWKTAINSIKSETVRSVLKMLYLSVLLDCSYAKNSGQFLRTDKSQEIADPSEAIGRQIETLERSKGMDSSIADKRYFETNECWVGDSRSFTNDDIEPNMVITSPPYPNRYDYTRSYSLELAFESVDTNDELIELRHDLLRSHIESKTSEEDFEDAHPVVDEVLDSLQELDLNNNKIPDMISGYFVDMGKSLRNLSELLQPEARIFLVVDNVRYEGEIIPVDLVIADLAEQHGFDLKRLMITRYKGNSSQQMGKYERVPVRESILWMERGY